jgi:hypothetical protein
MLLAHWHVTLLAALQDHLKLKDKRTQTWTRSRRPLLILNLEKFV